MCRICSEESEKLNRFTCLKELQDLLTSGKLSLQDPANWNDRNDVTALDTYRKMMKMEKLFAKCFLHQSETMFHWKTYADGPYGCCIEFDKRKLLDSIKPPGNSNRRVVPGLVKYRTIDWVSKHVGDIETKKIPFIKRWPYRPEKEYRILGEGNKDETKIDLEFSLQSIRKITLSQLMPKYVYKTTKEQLREIISDKSLVIEINQSTMYWNPCWIRAFRKRGEGMPSGQ